jgi:hypothetical protein
MQEGTISKRKIFNETSHVHKGKGFAQQAWSGSWGSRRLRLLDILDFRHYEGGKVITLTHRPSSPPGVAWYSFVETESTPGHMVSSAASEKIAQRHHWESIPRLSD